MPAIDYYEAHGAGSSWPASQVKAGAGPYDLPPAAPASPSHLTPELAAKVDGYRADAYAGPICPACRAQGARELYGGRCRHRPTLADKARQEAWERHAYATRLVQELAAGYLGTGSARVVPYDQAAQEDSHGGRPTPVDRVNFLP
jgi:hypothetical protein